VCPVFGASGTLLGRCHVQATVAAVCLQGSCITRVASNSRNTRWIAAIALKTLKGERSMRDQHKATDAVAAGDRPPPASSRPWLIGSGSDSR
jgi:hypothetical protein